MNKRIKELVEKANGYFCDGYPSAEGGDEAWKNTVLFEQSEELEAFAISIINECAKKANAIAIEVRNDQKLDARTYVGNGILQCFGIK